MLGNQLGDQGGEGRLASRGLTIETGRDGWRKRDGASYGCHAKKYELQGMSMQWVCPGSWCRAKLGTRDGWWGVSRAMEYPTGPDGRPPDGRIELPATQVVDFRRTDPRCDRGQRSCQVRADVRPHRGCRERTTSCVQVWQVLGPVGRYVGAPTSVARSRQPRVEGDTHRRRTIRAPPTTGTKV